MNQSDNLGLQIFGTIINLLVFAVFLILKLTDTVGWSWWWITSPLWIPFGFGIILGIIIAAIKLVQDNL